MPTIPSTPSTPSTPPTPPTPRPTTPSSKPSQKPRQRNQSGPRTKNGSYRHYYSRRNHGVHSDDRLPLLRHMCNSHPTSFTLLDIGCNDGTLTTELASITSCTRAVGLDINPNLIGDARKKLRSLLENRSRAPAALQGPLPRLCETLPSAVRHALHLGKEPRIRNGVMDNSLLTNNNGENSFPANVMFRTEDFARPEETRTSREVAQYDIVLCLSVTKWVHFAWGDKGLQRMFRRIYQCLKPTGILILEPQPMKSYKSAIRKGLGKNDFNGQRKLRPHEFADYLKFPIGFKDMKVLRKTRERGHAFNRPIMAFLKGSLWTLPLTSQDPYNVFGEDPHNAALEHVNNVHHHVFPVAPGLGVIVPGNELPADPAPPNVVPPNLAPAPSTETQAVNADEEDSRNEQTDNDRGNEGGRTRSSIVVQQENTIRGSQQPVNPEVSTSTSNETEQHVSETARDTNIGAANDGEVVPRTSGCKRRRSEEGTEESDERSAKVVKHDTDATEQ